MSYAVIVENVTKQFGKQETALWKRMLKIGNHQNGNGQKNGVKGSNGSKKIVVAVDCVSFEIKETEIFGVLGPNGGGKSTLIRKPMDFSPSGALCKKDG